MTAKKKRRKLSEEEIDTIVETQAADDSVWEKPIKVRKRKSASGPTPDELADRIRSRLKKRVRDQRLAVDVAASALNKRSLRETIHKLDPEEFEAFSRAVRTNLGIGINI